MLVKKKELRNLIPGIGFAREALPSFGSAPVNHCVLYFD